MNSSNDSVSFLTWNGTEVLVLVLIPGLQCMSTGEGSLILGTNLQSQIKVKTFHSISKLISLLNTIHIHTLPINLQSGEVVGKREESRRERGENHLGGLYFRVKAETLWCIKKFG